jgi:polysaccharide biosynthesis/export protein
MKKRSILLFLALTVAGCARPVELVGGPDVTVVAQSSLPPPATSDLISDPRSYVIGPLDQLSIEVYGVSELSRTVQVDASGKISMPLIGSIEAAGKAPRELATLVEDSLRGRYVRDPQVTVNLTETQSQILTVDGEVRQPGAYPVVGRMTLMRAIARAQGVTEFARENYVVVFRRVNNQNMAALYDLRAIRQGLYADPEVYVNDVVLVGESNSRRVFKDVLQASGVITAPIIALIPRL